MENVNCLRCHFRHEDNGNCTAVGGFCTAVPAAHCPLLREYLDTELTPEEVSELVKDWSDFCTIVGECGGLDRVRALAEANRDGRPSQYIEVLPAADVASVVHGCFEPCFDENGNWRQGFAKCSNCGKEYYAQVINHFGYCPNCGAKMDGERKDGGDG